MKKLLLLSVSIFFTFNNYSYANDDLEKMTEISDTIEPTLFKVTEYSAAHSSFCYDHFYDYALPVTLSRDLYENTLLACSEPFVGSANKKTKTAIFSAEYLTKTMVINSHLTPEIEPQDFNYRRNRSVPEEYAPLSEEYSGLFDKKSLYTLTELSPSANQTTELDKTLTYLFTNVIPANRKLNTGLLNNINKGLRKHIYENAHEAFIVTGVYFTGSSYRIGDVNGPAVPAYIYKAFFFPRQNAGSAYWISNNDENQFEVISLNELKNRVKIDFFPTVPEHIKSTVIYPPKPFKGAEDYITETVTETEHKLEVIK